MENEILFIDFDSTFVQCETLEVLAEISLAHHPERDERLAQIKALTDQAMEGSLSFAEALDQRLRLLNASRREVELCITQLARQVSPSIARSRQFIRLHHEQIYILSSGFYEIIQPIVKDYGISADHIFANRFHFDFDGRIVGADPSNPLAGDLGKVAVVEELGLSGHIVMVGDGYTDMEVRDKGAAHKFYAFTENVSRESIVSKADEVLPSFESYLKLHVPDMRWSDQGSKALLLESVHPAAAARLQSLGYTVETLDKALDEDSLIEALQGVSVLGIRSKTKVTRRVLEAAPDLLVVAAFCIGTNQIDLQACTERGVAAFNAPYSNTRSVVELAIGEMIMLTRKAVERNRLMHAGTWDKSAAGSNEIRGKTLGIVGYGNIGSQLSILAEALGMQVLYHDLAEKLPLGNARPCATLEELLRYSDIVSIHVDGRSSNTKLIGSTELSQMREGACLLNLSRGSVVDVDALAESLRSGQLAGAAVDVFPEEPKARGDAFASPLRDLPNVILTPHVGGSTQEAQENIGDFVSARIGDYLQRAATVCSVNFPQIQLPGLGKSHRLVHIHRNVPGVIAAISKLIAAQGVNIEAQYLETNDSIGYLIMDVDAAYEDALIEELRAIEHTLNLRVLT